MNIGLDITTMYLYMLTALDTDQIQYYLHISLTAGGM